MAANAVVSKRLCHFESFRGRTKNLGRGPHPIRLRRIRRPSREGLVRATGTKGTYETEY